MHALELIFRFETPCTILCGDRAAVSALSTQTISGVLRGLFKSRFVINAFGLKGAGPERRLIIPNLIKSGGVYRTYFS